MSAKKVPDTGDLFRDMEGIVKILRQPGGCPWDREQTLETGVKDLLGEADEVREAMERCDYENLAEELGDLLWSILFTINIGREEGKLDIESILKATKEKMIRRHPHVFGGVKAESKEHASELFKQVKEMEKNVQ